MRQTISTIVRMGCAALALLVLTSDGSAQIGIKRGGFYPGGSILNDNLGYRGGSTGGSSYGATGFGFRNRYLTQPSVTVGSNPSANQFFSPLTNGSIAPPRLSPSDGRGTITVKVPANAEVFWNGTKSTLTGNTRLYSTLPLSADGAVQTFEARWIGPNGQPVSQHRDVRALPNTTVNVDFLRPESDGKTPASN